MASEYGRKKFIAIEDGYWRSDQSWSELLLRIKAQGLQRSHWLAIGDGALGFWKALSKVFPETIHQRCWVHKTSNALNNLPKLVKVAWHKIWIAPIKEDAYKTFEVATQTYSENCQRRWNA